MEPNITTRPERDPDRLWDRIVNRDRTADSTFVYAVRTTGIYCRPSCAARRPLRKNVCFYASNREAQAAGFRPCRRCKPDGEGDRYHELIETMCRYLDARDSIPSLSELAVHVGLSTSHTHRLFRSAIGLTPQQYAAEGRAVRLRAAIHQQSGPRTSSLGISRAIYEAGYGAPSRLYESSDHVLGMTPSQYRAGAPRLAIQYAFGRSSLGLLLVARTARGICAVALGDTEHDLLAELRTRFPRASLSGPSSELGALLDAIACQTESPAGARSADPSTFPLDLQGTIFQRRVWTLLRDIPPGATVSYAELADRLGHPKGARAVARACATNPVAVLVPCHRVVRGNGELAGYRWGLERKKELLAREAVARRPAQPKETR